MREPSFHCSIRESKTQGVWVGRCRSLDICTQGASPERAELALVDAIILHFKYPDDDYEPVVAIPFSLIAEKARA